MPAWPPLCLPSVVLPSQSTATGKTKLLRTLGARIGVQKAAIYKYENGLVVNLKRSILEKLAIVLDTTPTYLMGMEDSAQQANVQLTPQQSTLLAAFDQLNEEGQTKAVEYVEDLVLTGRYKKRPASGLGAKDA